MYTLIAFLGGILAASGTVPYVIATIKRQTRPRIVTWLTWALLTALASAAAFGDHQIGSGLFALLGTLSTGAVVVTGLRSGDRSFARLDVVCMAGVVLGLVLWLLFNSPAIGVWMAIIIDFVGLIPTAKHAWQAPHEETALTYALVGVGGFMSVVAIVLQSGISVTGIGYPFYAGLSLGLLAIMIGLRRAVLPQPTESTPQEP
ncbi:MAG TPA: hypothetical protein VLF91_05435 [Candidatus Saccharimonadales bacterium]|nr:hypothetical protein [Candidatus Saccharimonadales bacterium]